MKLQRADETANNVNRWLDNIKDAFGLPVKRVSKNHWELGLRHKQADYSVTVKNQNPWMTYSATLFPDVEGRKVADFHGQILDINARLNGAKIGRESNMLAVIKERPTADLTEATFDEDIAIIHEAHKSVYGSLLESARDLGLKFKKTGK